MPEFSLETARRTHVVDITRHVRGALGDTSGAAAVSVYVPHTSAGVVVQEYADPAVGRDLEMALERIVDDGWPWEHLEEADLNPWSHVRAALTATSVVIPLVDGELALGTWQGIYFCDFDGPRTRRVLVTLLA
ncbi:MAG: secondary thiamine-phosphate synthase enzyme YjbQ [Gaiellales bacterium]